MNIVFATDHAGFDLKNILVAYVRDELGYAVEDLGAMVLDPEDDYTDYIPRAAQRVAADPLNTRAIILGGSGQGEAIAANRMSGVRTIVYYGGPLEIVRLSRQHNDANVLSLGARFVDTAEAKEAVKLWLETPFSEDARHVRRIAAIDT